MISRIFFLLLLILAPLHGHAVKQTYGLFTASEDEWSLKLTFDIGLAKGDALDPDEPQPRREELYAFSEEQHAELRESCEKVTRDLVKMTPANYGIRFPNYDTKPYEFPNLRLGGAYLHVELFGPLPSLRNVTFELQPGNCPLFVLHKDDDFTNAWPGDQVNLLVGAALYDSATVRPEPRFDFRGFLKVGFVHVVPQGWDHVLFVIGLCLLQLKLRPVLWQSLAFTVAHSVTLGFAAAGYLPAGGIWVEIFIAASIAVMGFSSLRESKLGTWRLLLVVVFGLIHGMGFAGALAEPLQESADFLPALATMNLGVELAQVVVIVLVFAFFALLRKEKLRRAVRILCAIGIGLAGLWLTAERLLTV